MTRTPPRLNVTLRGGRLDFTPDTCPSCARTIAALQPPPDPTPAEQERHLTRFTPARWFTIEPCGHEVALFLTIEP